MRHAATAVAGGLVLYRNLLALALVPARALAGSKGPKLGFFMYPNAENANGRYDSLDPDQFKYTITAKGIKA